MTSRRAWLARATGVAAVVATVAIVGVMGVGAIGCGPGAPRTLLVVRLEAGASLPPVQSVDLSLTLAGRNAAVTLAEETGAPVAFPTSDVLEIASGSGSLQIQAIARDASGVELDRVSGTVAITAGETTALTLVFGRATPDAASDAAPIDAAVEDAAMPDAAIDGATPDAATPPDLIAPPGDDGPTHTVPTAPGNVVASVAPLGASVAWTEPASDGGSAIIAYVVTATPDGVRETVLAPVTSAFVNGLRAGVSYTFTVHATNAVGAGPESAASNAVTPTPTPSLPGPPGAIVATAVDHRSAGLTWTAAPANGSPITQYELTTTPATLPQTIGSATAATLTGLTPGVQYTISIRATNGVGQGPAGTSNPIVAGDLPGAPTNTKATPLPGLRALVSFVPPVAGLPAVTSFSYTGNSPTAPAVGGSGSGSPFTVGPLTAGATYTFIVNAKNSIGIGAASTVATVLIGDVPGVPLNLTANSSGQGSATLAWSPPAATNGYPIQSYTVRTSSGIAATLVSGTTAQFNNVLTGGASFTFTVTATNGVGPSPAATATLTIPCMVQTRSIVANAITNVQYLNGSALSGGFLHADLSPTSDSSGWSRFDLTAIPVWAGVDSITFSAWQVSGATATLVLFASDKDGWPVGTAMPAEVPRTAQVSGSVVVGPTGPYSFPLNLAARNWSADLADHALSLGLTNRSAGASNAAFSADSPAPSISITTCE